MSARHWYSRKHYLHFDVPLGRRRAEQLDTDPTGVATHAFFPFLAYKRRTPRMKKARTTAGRRLVRDFKDRPISYPAHKDGYIFAYYKTLLEKPYEQWVLQQGLEKSITAFRTIGANNISLAKEAFEYIAANPNYSVVVADVNSFFPNIDHQLLKGVWSHFLGVDRLPDDHFAVFKATTQYAEVKRYKAYNAFRIPLHMGGAHDRRRICTPHEFRTKIAGKLTELNPGLADGVGIPQGSPLSPLLSNMYMARFDSSVHDWIKSVGGAYWRYCDDILVVSPIESDKVVKQFEQSLALARLELHKDKTRIYPPNSISPTKPLQYLGFMNNGRNVTVRSSSIHRYHRKIKAGVRAAQNRRQQESEKSSTPAPLRTRALFNMYSDRKRRGSRIIASMKNRKFAGNFTHYLERAAEEMNSERIARQRRRALKRLRDRIKDAT